MPTNKIESRDEAAKAFREGAYFKVGDRFISPDEIVTARRDQDGNPMFKLTTGETVTHSQFTEGSTGHFLFEQLRKVEGRYVEKIKPAYNRIFLGGGVYAAYDAAGNKVLDFGADFSGNRGVSVDIENNYVFGGASGTLYRLDLSDNTEISTSVTNASAQTGIAIDRKNQRVYAVAGDGSSTTYVYQYNYDLTNETLLVQVTTSNGQPKAVAFDVLPSEGVGIFNPDTNTHLLDITNKTNTVITQDFSQVTTRDTLNGELLVSFGNGKIRRYDTQGNKVGDFSQGISSDLVGLSHNADKDVLVYSDKVTGEVYEVPNGGGPKTKLLSDGGINVDGGLDLALDLSAV